MSLFHFLTVKEVRPELADCVSVSFAVPAELAHTFQYQAGQYLTFRTSINGEEVRRSYSICSAPEEGELRVAIKKIEGGAFSSWANDNLRAGDVIEAMPPDGKFTRHFPETRAKNYLGVAAGSGITPVMSLLKTVLAEEPHSSFTLIYGNRGRANVLFKEELDALKNRFLGRLRIYHVFSREAMEVPLFNGRINREKALQFCQHLIRPQSLDEVFICGPEEMILSVRDTLQEQGIPENRIHFELFATAAAIAGKPVKKAVLSEEQSEAVSQVRITLDGITTEFSLPYGGANILDAALAAGADLPYACKGGVCATCRARITEGEIEMDVNYSLEADDVARGFALTCQSHPRSAVVAVDFDQR